MSFQKFSFQTWDSSRDLQNMAYVCVIWKLTHNLKILHLLSCYVEIIGKGPTDDSGQGFQISACRCIPLQLPLAYVNQPEVRVVNESYHIIITANFRLSRMARWLEGNTRKYTGRGSMTSSSMRTFSMASI
jgi:hypothetical protein